MSYSGGSRCYIAHDHIYLIGSWRQSDGFLIGRLAVLRFTQLLGSRSRNYRILKDARAASGDRGDSSKNIDSCLLQSATILKYQILIRRLNRQGGNDAFV